MILGISFKGFAAVDNVTGKVIPIESSLDKLFKYFKNGEVIKISQSRLMLLFLTLKREKDHIQSYNYDVEFEKDPQIFNNCPGYLTENDGTTSNTDPDYVWIEDWWNDPCVTKGAHMGGNKGGAFKGAFLKFFKKNLLN